MKNQFDILKRHFSYNTRQQIITYKRLIAGLEVFSDVVIQYNKRKCDNNFLLALRLKGGPYRLLFRLLINPKEKNQCLFITDRHSVFYFTRKFIELDHQICITIINSGGKINSYDTLENIKSLKNQLKLHISDLQKDILLFDQEFFEWQNIVKTIKNHTHSYSFRLIKKHSFCEIEELLNKGRL